jgi:transposase
MQFDRWKKKGLFIKMHDHLRATLREALGRNAEASVGIADSQSVKTAEKKGSVDLRRIKELRVGNDTYWLISLD